MAIVQKRSKTDPKLRWFEEARFGMFIHFGIYAQLGLGEWVQYERNIPRHEYEKLIHTFNPSRFDADDWVGLAEEAGCKYVTFTAKHHDGFCMFDSALTDYKITCTPFARDIVGELAEACRRRAVRIILYYSQPDWHHPNYVHLKGAFKDLDDPPPTDRPDWPAYLDYYQGQVRELCTNYGRIDGIWFDGSHKSEKTWRGREVYRMIKSLQPGAVVNDRARFGDFFTPERSLPEDLTGYMFEACQSVSKMHWGYSQDSPQFSVQALVESLVRLAGAGGNFLLNVGPKPDGTIPGAQAERMRAIGRWLETNGSGIYGTDAGGIDTGSRHVVATRKGRKLYVHLVRWPETDRVLLPGVLSAPTAAGILGSEVGLATRLREHGLEITGLPMWPPGPAVNVIELRFRRTTLRSSALRSTSRPRLAVPKHPGRKAERVRLRERGRTVLTVDTAAREGLGVKGARLRVVARGDEGPDPEKDTFVSNWTAPEQRLVWRVDASRAGRYAVRARLACAPPFHGSTYVVRGKTGSIAGKVRPTPRGVFSWQSVGCIAIPKGKSSLALRPVEMPYGYVFADVAALELRSRE